jgi:hypothetical protein
VDLLLQTFEAEMVRQSPGRVSFGFFTTPEPSTWAMMIPGFVGLFVGYRKARAHGRRSPVILERDSREDGRAGPLGRFARAPFRQRRPEATFV